MGTQKWRFENIIYLYLSVRNHKYMFWLRVRSSVSSKLIDPEIAFRRSPQLLYALPSAYGYADLVYMSQNCMQEIRGFIINERIENYYTQIRETKMVRNQSIMLNLYFYSWTLRLDSNLSGNSRIKIIAFTNWANSYESDLLTSIWW